jgi:tRNA modification GTPase
MYQEDTIAAISTPLGEGGIAVVRVSGPMASTIADRLFNGTYDGGLLSHRFYYGSILDPGKNEEIDEVMVVLMRAPRSYTREDVLEIHCHGGYLVVQRLLDLVVSQGARLAEPGEFTRRAFLNGRIDLVQAEAVIDIIRSKTDAALNLAQHQREGLLSRELTDIRASLLNALAILEAHIDFPDEDIDPDSLDAISTSITSAQARLSSLLAGFDEGKALREGVSVVIAGKPNVGKSSLLNTLLREKRAIVTAVPGTTRDIIEEVVNIKGLPVRMLDTAGVRETTDEVEQVGVDLALASIPKADLVIFLLDNSRPYDQEDLIIEQALGGCRVIVGLNKADLQGVLELPDTLRNYPQILISTKSGIGIDSLRDAIHDSFIHGQAVDSREYVALSRARHRDSILRSSASLDRFSSALTANATPELIALDLRDALHAIGEVTGETTPDDILNLIFSRFCIGK